jgi:hypothetical protein
MGGTGLRARCSPCAAANPVLIASDAEAAGRARGCSNCNQRRDLMTEGPGRRSLPPAQFDPIGERSMAVPWRERPRDLAGSAIMLAATEEVAHASCLVSAGVDDLLDATGAVRKGARNLHRLFIGRRTRLCGSRSRAQGAPRCFARACARLAALTARSASL